MRRRTVTASGRWFGTVILTVALLAAGGAWAHDGSTSGGGDGTGTGGSEHSCRPACNQVRGTCKTAASTAYQSCASQCQAAIMTDNCFRVCRQEFQTARSTCHSDCHDCKNTCPPPGGGGGGGGACDDACMADLSTCVSGLGSAAHDCANGCATQAQSSFNDCLAGAGSELLGCLMQASGVLGDCLGECAGTLREGTSACKEAADICRQNCQTGSASRAFLDAKETLLD